MAIRTSTRSTSSQAADQAEPAAGTAKAARSTRKARAGTAAAGGSRPGRHQQCLDAVAAANTWLATRAQCPLGPWSGLAGLPRKVADGTNYAGTNVIILMAAQDSLGFRSALWGGFNALKEKGLKLARGSHHTGAVFSSHGERKSATSTLPKTGLDSTDGQGRVSATGNGDIDTSQSGDPDRRKRSVIPFLQPVALFNVTQCEGFLPDPKAQIPQERLASIRNHWLEACAHALAQFTVWNEANPGVGFNPEESTLTARLAADFAVLRRTGETEAITAALPAVPDLGARFMKVCGVAWELSEQVADKVFGCERAAEGSGGVTAASTAAIPAAATASPASGAEPTDTAQAGTAVSAMPGAIAVKAPRKPRRAKREAPGEAPAPVAGTSATHAEEGVAVAQSVDVQEETPEWIGVW